MDKKLRRIDLKKLTAECGLPKLEAFKDFIVTAAVPDEEIEVVVGDADTWYALKNLGDELGYEVLDSYKKSDKEYIVVIKVI